MKIAIIGTAYPYRGGLASYNERLASAFQEQGHDTVIYTFTLQYPNFLFPGKSQYSSSPAPKNLIIKRIIHSINPFNWIKTGRKIKKENYDLLIIKYWLPFMGPCFGTILRIIKKNKKTKIICILDNIIPHEKRVGDTIFTKYFVEPVDGFVAMSKNVYDDLSIFDTKKPRTLSPHPLFDNFGEITTKETAKINLKLDPNKKYILFFGLIRDYKGLDLLLKAMNSALVKKLNITLIIAGEYYANANYYHDLIKELNLSHNIIEVARFIPDEEVANYFNAADLVVQPYKSATQSGVTQIAYHFNKPMIVTDVGGLAEICPNDKVGYVVPVDENAIAQAIYNFYIFDKENEMIENIKLEKQKYSWEVLTKAILNLYQQ
jgi:glycosyltransferase involved in cell wall biosynthesis